MGADENEIAWLIEQTGQSREEVERGLQEGRLRRRAVVTELLEAGLHGAELLQMVVRLTGLPEDEARRLIAAESSGGQGDAAAP
jgi:hypothetical protein